MKCIVLSDIHGNPADETCFLHGQECPLTVQRVRLADLLGFEAEGEGLHRHLVQHGGFDAAAAKVRDLVQKADIGLGYSAGGTVLWRSVLLGLRLERLICISSTRLRTENPEAMRVPTLAVFGELDEHRPPASWGAGSGIQVALLGQAGHAFYRSRDPIWTECRRVVQDFVRQAEIPA